jgi:hypothetical protein
VFDGYLFASKIAFLKSCLNPDPSLRYEARKFLKYPDIKLVGAWGFESQPAQHTPNIDQTEPINYGADCERVAYVANNRSVGLMDHVRITSKPIMDVAFFMEKRTEPKTLPASDYLFLGS